MNLVFITVDTLKVDVGFMGYDRPVTPNLDALAARSVVFDRMYSMASYTGKSIGPLLIGKYPSETSRDAGHFNTYYPDNTLVTERLRGAGFHTMGAASHWYFVPWSGLTQGMDEWDTSAMPPSGQGDVDTSVTSEQLTDAAIRMLKKPASTSSRFFLWVHYFDPHEQYMPHPEAPAEIRGGGELTRAADQGGVRRRGLVHRPPPGAADRLHHERALGREHGDRRHERPRGDVRRARHELPRGELWEPLVRVPLVVYFPGARPHHVPVKRSHVDLVPTMLELLGVDLPSPADRQLSGRSMLPDLTAGEGATYEERDVYIDMPVGPFTGMRHALITGPTPGLKLYNMGPNQFALFDLAADPGELDDIVLADRERFRTLVGRFTETRAQLREVAATATAPGAAPAAPSASTTPPSP